MTPFAKTTQLQERGDSHEGEGKKNKTEHNPLANSPAPKGANRKQKESAQET